MFHENGAHTMHCAGDTMDLSVSRCAHTQSHCDTYFSHFNSQIFHLTNAKEIFVTVLRVHEHNRVFWIYLLSRVHTTTLNISHISRLLQSEHSSSQITQQLLSLIRLALLTISNMNGTYTEVSLLHGFYIPTKAHFISFQIS